MTAASGDAPRAETRALVALGNYALNGQERGNIEVFRAVRERGVEALFVTHEAWGHAHLQPALDRLGLGWTTLDYARHFTKRLSLKGWAKNILHVFRASWGFRRIARRYKPTHIHVANQHYVLSVLPALLLMRTPVIFRLGDVPTQHHRFHRIIWQWFIVPRVTQFVCVSEFIRQSLLATGAPAEKAVLLYTAPPERPAPERSYSATPFSGTTVAYIGQIRPHKGVHLFVEAALALCQARDDVRFVLAGSVAANDPFALGVVQRVQAAGVGDRVYFAGYVEDIPGLFEASDLHVCPSVCDEALSNTVLEAKRAGVPSVVFPSGGLPELVVEQGRDGWVCAEPSADSLIVGIEHYLSMHADERQEAGRTAHRSMETLGVTTDAFAERWAQVYGQPARLAKKPVAPVGVG